MNPSKLPLTYRIAAVTVLLIVIASIGFAIHWKREAGRQAVMAEEHRIAAQEIHLESLTLEVKLEASELARKSAEEIAKRINEIPRMVVTDAAPVSVLKAGETFTATEDILLFDPKLAAEGAARVAKAQEFKDNLVNCASDLRDARGTIKTLKTDIIRVKASRPIWGVIGFGLGVGTTILVKSKLFK